MASAAIVAARYLSCSWLIRRGKRTPFRPADRVPVAAELLVRIAEATLYGPIGGDRLRLRRRMRLNAVKLDARLVGPPAGECVDGFAQLFVAQSHRLDVVDPHPLVEAEFLLRDGQIEKPILPASQGASRRCWPGPMPGLWMIRLSTPV
jgi:hypothetical protein